MIISGEKVNDSMKIAIFLGDPGLLIKSVSKAIKNEGKEQKGIFLCMLLGTLGASLFGNMLAGKGVLRAGEETIRADLGF